MCLNLFRVFKNSFFSQFLSLGSYCVYNLKHLFLKFRRWDQYESLPSAGENFTYLSILKSLLLILNNFSWLTFEPRVFYVINFFLVTYLSYLLISTVYFSVLLISIQVYLIYQTCCHTFLIFIYLYHPQTPCY